MLFADNNDNFSHLKKGVWKFEAFFVCHMFYSIKLNSASVVPNFTLENRFEIKILQMREIINVVYVMCSCSFKLTFD